MELKTITRADWVAALRSGQFKQTIGALRKDGGYCCLGVACEIAGVDLYGTFTYADNPEKKFTFESPGNTAFFPGDIMDTAELEEYTETFPVFEMLQLTRREQLSLSEANDGGAQFSKIADMIEARTKELEAKNAQD